MAAPGEYLFSTSLKWKPDGELASNDRDRLTALVMVADKRPFEIPETQPMTYVALVADQTGRYAYVYGNSNSWNNFIDQLEDIGCEVIENQTNEWDNDIESIKEDCIYIQDLISKTDFVSYA
jgi:hypothetical protein